jgi:anti-sigma factor RsiW
MRLLSRDELVCQEAVELISDYIEGTLPRRERQRLDAHLAGCEHCSEYLAQIRLTIRLTGRLRADDLTPQMRADLLAVYRSWLTGEG